VTELYDILVVGGGINGAGIACDAAGRGLRVALCEQADLAQATSSSSSKMIHGGLRYLEYYEFGLVRKALQEREVMMAKAPHIIRPLRLYLPHMNSVRPAWMVRIGLFLYDHLARQKKLPKSQGINFRRHPAGQPLRQEFKAGFAYSDCWVDDSRLVVLNALSAARNGAAVMTRTRLIGARRVDGTWHAELRDEGTGRAIECRARILVNAAGPWVQPVLEAALDTPPRNQMRLVKGSHLVVPRLVDDDHGYLLQLDDRRVIFVLPFEGAFSLIGTTDITYDGDPADIRAEDDEIRYLCDAVNRYFSKQITPADVVWSFAGVRPLVEDEAADPAAVTRDYHLDLDANDSAPLLSVFGGKITTYRVLAEEAMAMLKPHLPQMGRDWTASAALPGGDMEGGDLAAHIVGLTESYPQIDPALITGIAGRHGALSRTIIGDAKAGADLGQQFGGGLTEREVCYLRENEWAATSHDILWRRTKAGLFTDDTDRARLDAYLAA